MPLFFNSPGRQHPFEQGGLFHFDPFCHADPVTGRVMSDPGIPLAYLGGGTKDPFPPAMKDEIERVSFDLTFSMVGGLMDDCPCCFWVRAQAGLRRPLPIKAMRGARPIERELEGMETNRLSPDLPVGRCVRLPVRISSIPIHIPGCDQAVRLSGWAGVVMRFEDGTWGIARARRHEPGATRFVQLGRELHAVARVLEHPAPGTPCLSPVTRLGVVLLRSGRQPVWLEHARNDAAFERYLGHVLTLLALPSPPSPSRFCRYCRYCSVRRNHQKGFALMPSQDINRNP